MTAPDSPAVDLTKFIDYSSLVDAVAPDTSFTLSASSCTFYVKIKKSDNASQQITNIPSGTAYTVTEVYNTSDGDMSLDPNRPHVSYSSASGTIADSTVANATVTNTYRQIILTKKDAKKDSNNQNYNFKMAMVSSFFLKY